MKITRMSGLVVLALTAAILSAGCVAQSEVDKQRALYRKAQEQVVELRNQLEQAQDQLAALRGSKGKGAKLAGDLKDARAEVQRLRKALSSAKTALAETKSGPGELSPQLVSKLQTLAKNNPELMSFDADRKMVRLKSDLTFDLGSTNVKTRAEKSLARLAQVLQSQDAKQFEVRVVGHTDNVPVTNPANKRKYEDNWGLSAFRAKSVMEVLANHGINEHRMSIAGYGSQQPVVPNPKRGGAEPNRRVEIFLFPPYNAGGQTPGAQEPGQQDQTQDTGENSSTSQNGQSQTNNPPTKGGPSQSTQSSESDNGSGQSPTEQPPRRFK